jgi:hypothetical protein
MDVSCSTAVGAQAQVSWTNATRHPHWGTAESEVGTFKHGRGTGPRLNWGGKRSVRSRSVRTLRTTADAARAGHHDRFHPAMLQIGWV